MKGNFLIILILLFSQTLLAQVPTSLDKINNFFNDNFDVIITAAVGIIGILGVMAVSKNTIRKILEQTQMQIDAQAEQTRLQIEFQYKLNKKQVLIDIKKLEIEEIARDIANLIGIFEKGEEVINSKWEKRDVQDLKVIDEMTDIIKTYTDKKYEVSFFATKLKLAIGSDNEHYDFFFERVKSLTEMIFENNSPTRILTKEINHSLSDLIKSGEEILRGKRKELEKM